MVPNPFVELPLAIFSTLVPLSAGAFVAIALAIFAGNLKDDQLKALDKLTIAPVAIMVVGIVASFFHLANPMNAIYIFGSLGSSPLSNEILVTVVFAVLAIVYLAAALSGKCGACGARKGLLVAVVVAGLAQTIFTGLAYSIATIPGWATAWVPVEMVGFMLAGTAIGMLAVSLAKADDAENVRKLGAIVVVAGVVIAIFAVAAHVMQVSGMSSELVSGAALVSAATPYAVSALACGIVGAACCFVAMKKECRAMLYGVSAVAVLVAVFLARLAFYCLQMGVGF